LRTLRERYIFCLHGGADISYRSGQQPSGCQARPDGGGLEAFGISGAALQTAETRAGADEFKKIDPVMLAHPVDLAVVAIQRLQLGIDIC
jgi:hypothetical protein